MKKVDSENFFSPLHNNRIVIQWNSLIGDLGWTKEKKNFLKQLIMNLWNSLPPDITTTSSDDLGLVHLISYWPHVVNSMHAHQALTSQPFPLHYGKLDKFLKRLCVCGGWNLSEPHFVSWSFHLSDFKSLFLSRWHSQKGAKCDLCQTPKHNHV